MYAAASAKKTPVKPKALLPQQEKWRECFQLPFRHRRLCLADHAYAEYWVDKFIGDNASLRDKYVIDMLSGPGLLTDALLKRDTKRVICVEYENCFVNEHVKRLEQHGERVVMLSAHGMTSEEMWFSPMGSQGELPKYDWEIEHPSIVLTGMLTVGRFTRVAHTLFDAYDRARMFRYGRIPIIGICEGDIVKCMLAQPGDAMWRSTSIWLHSLCEFEVLEPVPSNMLWNPGRKDYFMVKLIPKVTPLLKCDVNSMKYVLTLLMARRRQPLHKVIRLLGPNASVLLDGYSGDPNRLVQEMLPEEFNEIAQKFATWPQRPHIPTDFFVIER